MNKVITFLETVGKDVEHGIEKAAPFMTAMATTLTPLLPGGAGPIVATVIGTVIQVEQKFAAIGKQSGTGPAKLADALTVLGPVVSQSFAAAKLPSDGTTVANFISRIVDFLNAIPVGTSPAVPATA